MCACARVCACARTRACFARVGCACVHVRACACVNSVGDVSRGLVDGGSGSGSG